MTLSSRLAELELRLGGGPCPACGHDPEAVLKPGPKPLDWLTTPELEALRALWQRVTDRHACVHCGPRDPCPRHRGNSISVHDVATEAE